MKTGGDSLDSAMSEAEHFGFEGTSPPIEYIGSFVGTYFQMKNAMFGHVVKRKPTDEEVGHFCKAAWAAFNMGSTPEEYLRPLILKYQRMPEHQSFPQPHQLSSKFAISVAEVERIKKVEQLPSLRAEELAKENYRLKIGQDSDYQRFIVEFEKQSLEHVGDSEFKLSYCMARETQTWGEPSEFLRSLQEEATTKNLWRPCE